jgi:hypothetical protein
MLNHIRLTYGLVTIAAGWIRPSHKLEDEKQSSSKTQEAAGTGLVAGPSESQIIRRLQQMVEVGALVGR